MVYHPEDVNGLNYQLRFHDGRMPDVDWVAQADCEEVDSEEVDVTHAHGPRPAGRHADRSAVGSPSVVDRAEASPSVPPVFAQLSSPPCWYHARNFCAQQQAQQMAA